MSLFIGCVLCTLVLCQPLNSQREGPGCGTLGWIPLWSSSFCPYSSGREFVVFQWDSKSKVERVVRVKSSNRQTKLPRYQKEEGGGESISGGVCVEN